MVDSQDETDSGKDTLVDSQLTIKIPNPRTYVARQSAWIGRRGKPRCDHCRLNNLKCDRILPTCNHCSWAAGRECRYTPLPTPAHRGIPRCDRCRRKNLKCDRNLPVCNHCSEDDGAECNYTPKKRHKAVMDQSALHEPESPRPPHKPDSASPTASPAQPDGISDSKRAHTFYGQNVASATTSAMNENSPRSSPPMGSPGLENSAQTQTGRFTADYLHTMASDAPGPSTAPKLASGESSLSFISHSFSPGQGMIVNGSYVQPWSHPSFTPLPEMILQRLGSVPLAEMPNREEFDANASAFFSDLMPELKETASLLPDVYASVSRSLSKKDTSKLTTRLRNWISLHHVCSGSSKYSLLLVPREAVFQMAEADAAKLLKAYRSDIDGVSNVESDPHANVDYAQAFERWPVRNQLYDVLAYAHSSHGSPPAMVFELRKAGIAFVTWPMIEIFIRLCPLCKIHARRASQVSKVESSSDTCL